MNRVTLLQVLAVWILNTVLCGKIGVPVFNTEGSSNGVCPSESVRDYLRSTLRQEVRTQLQSFAQDQEQAACTGIMTCVINFNDCMYYTVHFCYR